MSRLIAGILLVAVIVIGGGVIATTAYQAGLSNAVTTAPADGGTVVVPAYGYGWHPAGFGFGFFGFLATLFFLFVVFALVRAIFWRGGPGRRGGGPGWDGAGWYGHGKGQESSGRSPWEARAHETFDDWHRRAHGEAPGTGSDDTSTPTGTA